MLFLFLYRFMISCLSLLVEILQIIQMNFYSLFFNFFTLFLFTQMNYWLVFIHINSHYDLLHTCCAFFHGYHFSVNKNLSISISYLFLYIFFTSIIFFFITLDFFLCFYLELNVLISMLQMIF